MGRLLRGVGGRIVSKAVLSARDEAAQILAEAREQAERDAEELRLRGYQDGLAAGRETAAAEMTELFVRARADAHQAREATRENAIVLARRMAERIVGRALELHPSLITDIAVQALGASRAAAGTVIIRAHPDDIALLEQERPRLTARLALDVDLRLVGDPSVTRGGCVVETPVARLDAQLSVQLDAFERALAGRAAHGS